MAKKQAAPETERKVLLLVDCAAGKCGGIVELDADAAAVLVAAGEGDDNAAAVAAHE